MAFISYFSEVSQKSDVACSLLVSKEDDVIYVIVEDWKILGSPEANEGWFLDTSFQGKIEKGLFAMRWNPI